MNTTYRNRIYICRVYTPPKVKEGVWILVDRLWPRGIKKEALAFDFWLKDITPSATLRQLFHGNSGERWSEFVDCYIEELNNKGDLINHILEQAECTSITLFYAAKDLKHNHALILQSVLYSWPQKPDKKLLL
ncbi:DUF488 domain-containing protein [Legionella parisiensis]|uniref:Uroporphyrin-III C-methyltransferase n=1 Tax=Legionella parisiensis TaxID=45071 RepID=A0A1E5JVJ4_9GAMM|nr:DUF488 family protein [Legionella parisiensis]KTD40810.1 uroporphyrin-III C- methyltransferase [Legionella parisiensis]OEH48495.1 hypothetical protein lpari_00498 [Legionella parisiensis]STX72089.1 uroporphyrin-III C-methyltransferase [Legionella parisiensis]HAT8808081.1 DUF488 family protein [Legionella pneumophila]